MVELCQQLSRSWRGCQSAHTTGKGCREQEGAAVLSGALLVEDLFFPPKKDVGEFNKLLCCNKVAACSNQEWL